MPAIVWGARGRGFKSRRPDKICFKINNLQDHKNRKSAPMEHSWNIRSKNFRRKSLRSRHEISSKSACFLGTVELEKIH
jgi:hypothetical protein